MDLTRDQRPDAEAIRRCDAGTDALCAAFADASAAERAAIAMVLGARGDRAAAATLMGGLDEEGLAGRAAAWALGRVGTQDELLAACADGRLDRRENAYWALAHLAARDAADPGLGDAMVAPVEAETARAAEGGSGLGEHACRVLAVLGDPRADECCERIVAEDPYADRFELDRLRRQLADEGRDAEGARELAADWDGYFADDLAVDQADAAEDAAPPAHPATPLGGDAGGPGPAPADEAAPGGEPAPPPTDAGGGDGEEDAAPEAEPVDWQGFAESPEARDLDPQLQQLLLQIGPMLEQLALGAVRVPLMELRAQEFAAVMLQVLPQAVQPQYVQALLSPEALRALQAWAKWVEAQGKGGELLAGVKMVREELQAQIRASGMLGGPDYGDPDDASSDATGTGTSTE